jgi:hypothetical protein
MVRFVHKRTSTLDHCCLGRDGGATNFLLLSNLLI